MDLNFRSIVDVIATYMFDGSSTLAGLALLIAAWAICIVLLFNMKASPAYSVVPMIPIAIFFSAYGILNETIMILIIIVSGVLVAGEFKKVVD